MTACLWLCPSFASERLYAVFVSARRLCTVVVGRTLMAVETDVGGFTTDKVGTVRISATASGATTRLFPASGGAAFRAGRVSWEGGFKEGPSAA